MYFCYVPNLERESPLPPSSSPSSPGSSLAESPEAAGVSTTAPLGPGAAGPGPGVPAVSGALRELLEACRNGDVSRVKRLVDAANVNAKDMAGRKSSPLHFAAGQRLFELFIKGFVFGTGLLVGKENEL